MSRTISYQALVAGKVLRSRMAEQATASGEVLDSALFESKDDGSRWKKRRQGFFVKLIDWVSPFQERGGM